MFEIPVYFKGNPQYCQEIVLLSRFPTAQANRCLTVNDVNKGSPSRMRRVRRISLGMTIRPRSSTRLTIPVAFISFPLLAVNSTVVLFAGNGELSENTLNVQTFFPVVNLALDVACLISYRNICSFIASKGG